jgi:SAM-dependent methyltransferase
MGGEPVVLNIGCGDDTRGVGIDVNYDTADIMADLNDGIPVADEVADRLIMEHVLEHLENPSFALRVVHRVLHPDGKAVLEVPYEGWLPVRLYITQDMHQFWEHKIPERTGHWLARRLGKPDPDRTQHLTLWTKKLLADHLDRADLDYRFINSPHWTRNIRVEAWITEK